ncbi:MAG: hypothetical protein B6242_10415 [Anaerolineaceae bacterium 4572_78]|nr:MAG: hypothetical protein B6242_10415 [Anaerolineaceae bacterium 4572_78]
MTRRLALLIGNGNYENEKQFPKLKTPQKDIESLAVLLHDPLIGNFEKPSCLVDELERTISREFFVSSKINVPMMFCSSTFQGMV